MAKPKNKYYAIKKGKDVGIFEQPWGEVCKLVQGFQNASYKGFPTLEEAEMWFNEESREVVKIEQDENTLISYVDGSSSMSIEEYGSGVVLIFPDGEVEELCFSGNHEDAKSMKNVAGELASCMRAMKVAKDMGFKKLIICHDYMGCSEWIIGNWKAKNNSVKKYIEWYRNNIKDYVDVSFKWVRGHSSDEYNDRADKLAKKAIGIE